MISNRRSRFLWSLIVLGFIVQTVQLTIVGCSHTSPYYHPEIRTLAKKEIVADTNLVYRILLLGDGGQPKPDEPVLKTLKKWAEKTHEKTSVVFLGDNMYPEGMTERKRHEAEERLDPQIDVIKSANVHGLFIPGNHDWANGKKVGYQGILEQEKYINNALSHEYNFLPRKGSPGPVAIELPESDPVVRIIVLDTQWWLQENVHSDESPETVISELKKMLNTELPVVVVGHHPIQSYGVHGGYYDWKDHLFPGRMYKKWLWVPVPIVGSLFPLTRWHLLKHEQDLNGNRYKELTVQLNSAFSTAKKSSILIYASGHDHSLQVLKGGVTDYLLVSGLGSSEKASPVSHGDNTLFAHQHTGFMALDFLRDERILLRVVEPGGEEVVLHYWLK